MAQDYWFVTRPKRKLDAIPEELAAFVAVALNQKWRGNRALHLAFEEELEHTGTKRIGERRDGAGSGGRTHAAMLYSLGLWFEKEQRVYLTLAGEAILAGKPLIPILKKQVIRFQYPSAYSESAKVTPRFRVRPFLFLLRLLSDSRIGVLRQEEIAYIVLIEAEKETDSCYEYVVKRILQYRESGPAMLSDEYFLSHQASSDNLMDVANTMMNWLDYTQLVYRDIKTIGILEEKTSEVAQILSSNLPFIPYPCDSDIFQRKYGVDPWHQKDTRNLLNTLTISSASIDRSRILRSFFNYSSLQPVINITGEIVDIISQDAGTNYRFTEDVLTSTYPNGALSGYLINYRNMAFKGKDEAIDFEKATANLFRDVFGYDARHLGQLGAVSSPDVLLISDNDGYQAIIDNKAYAQYSISGDHHNRMVYNYIKGIKNYSDSNYPIGFFTYICGGLANGIDQQIKKEVASSGTHGSAITVSNLISMIDKQATSPYSHLELRRVFGIDRQVHLSDI